MIKEYYSEIRKDIAKDFGLDAAGYGSKPVYYVSIRECQQLLAEHGFEKAQEIIKELKKERMGK